MSFRRRIRREVRRVRRPRGKRVNPYFKQLMDAEKAQRALLNDEPQEWAVKWTT